MEKKYAIVTGGSRGIGRAIVERLAKDGMDVVFSYQSNTAAADETVQACEGYGAKVVGIQADVSVPEECERFVKEAQEQLERVDVLVNNAGITRDNLIMRSSYEDLDKIVDVNLKGPFYMMKLVSRLMLKQRSGSIINMSSVVGVMGNVGQVNYAATKAAVIGMTKSLAKEIGKKSIRVNAIAPGMIATDMLADVSDDALKKMKEIVPLNEIGKPEDVAALVSFLAGDDSRYITGQVIHVDGGMAM